ncbi:AAA family ATPase [Paenibacillus ginsengarvi]|uniref:Shikimate kinase n=1 Tax=Paenibacillus ginsengarvi TaxID=400777 RepID=A0A3B0CGV9_9BACL|nr:AAA family ATPase [Paenibacillus ginsengarvi]RKN84390.1 shikimate kinase [Paenibacillus ginsengarvi]
MKLVIIFGPQAVGKMTVGQELAKITDLKLFHNHMTIDLVSPFFSYGTPVGKRLVRLFRQHIFEEVANSDMAGLIFTYTWAFNQQSDWDYIDSVRQIFESKGAAVIFVELESTLEARLERNKSPNRLEHKPTKRNVERSERDLLNSAENKRQNSREGELAAEFYIRIDNTHIAPGQVAATIKAAFAL